MVVGLRAWLRCVRNAASKFHGYIVAHSGTLFFIGWDLPSDSPSVQGYGLDLSRIAYNPCFWRILVDSCTRHSRQCSAASVDSDASPHDGVSRACCSSRLNGVPDPA